jgi:hypothetical protein
MSDPFRDDLAAALDRASLLADENRSLREEVTRLQGSAPSPRVVDPLTPPAATPAPAIVSPPDSMKDRALERLERLSHEIDVHAERTEPHPEAAPRAPRLVEPTPPVWRAPPPPVPRPLDLPAPSRDVTEGQRTDYPAYPALSAENASLRVALAKAKLRTVLVALGALFFGMLLGWLMGGVK